MIWELKLNLINSVKMWKSPNKLLFFDEEDFVIAEGCQSKSEVSDQTLGELTLPTRPEVTSMEYTFHGYETPSVHATSMASQSAEPVTAPPKTPRLGIPTECPLTRMASSMFMQKHRNTPPLHEETTSYRSFYSQSPTTTTSASLRFEPVQIPMQPVAFTQRPMDKARTGIFSTPELPGPIFDTRLLSAAECSMVRPFPVPMPRPLSSPNQLLQEAVPNQPKRLTSQSQQLISVSQSELSELQVLQFEALGARPRSTVVPTSRRRLSFEGTTEEDARLQNLCHLMEIQAQVNLGYSMSGLDPVYASSGTSSQSTPSRCPRSDRSGNLGLIQEQVSLGHSMSGLNPGYTPSGQSSLATSSRGPPGERSGNPVTHCNFCKRNGERRAFYSSHNLQERGRVTCPVLQRYVCPICGDTGESAHTVSYCPLGSGASSVAATRTLRKACGCKRVCKHGEDNRH